MAAGEGRLGASNRVFSQFFAFREEEKLRKNAEKVRKNVENLRPYRAFSIGYSECRGKSRSRSSWTSFEAAARANPSRRAKPSPRGSPPPLLNGRMSPLQKNGMIAWLFRMRQENVDSFPSTPCRRPVSRAAAKPAFRAAGERLEICRRRQILPVTTTAIDPLPTLKAGPMNGRKA